MIDTKDKIIEYFSSGIKEPKSFKIGNQYRTYDYLTAIKSAVYLEPIRVFTDVRGS